MPQPFLRRHVRLPADSQVQLSWRDARGRPQTQRARCLDLSAEGARLETETAIPARTRIQVFSAQFGGLGTASVRHCVRQKLKYSLGVEFTVPLALSAQGRLRCLGEIQNPEETS